MKINFASEPVSFRLYTGQMALKGTRKLCVWLQPFPLSFFPGLQMSRPTLSRCSGSAAFEHSARCFTGCFEFQVLRSILFGMWAVVSAPSVGLGRGSWEATVAAWGLWAGTWISSWTLCGNRKCQAQKTVTGDPCSLRRWPNLCFLNCTLPCTSDLRFCFGLAIPRCSSFLLLVQAPSKRNIFRVQVKDNAWTRAPNATVAYNNVSLSYIPTNPLMLVAVTLGLSNSHAAFVLGFKRCGVKRIMKPSCHISKVNGCWYVKIKSNGWKKQKRLSLICNAPALMAWNAGALCVVLNRLSTYRHRNVALNYPLPLYELCLYCWRDTLMHKKELLSKTSIFSLLKKKKIK